MAMEFLSKKPLYITDTLGLGDLAQGLHDDLPLRLGGEQAHDGGLDDGHQGHVAVGRHADGAQQLRGCWARPPSWASS